MFLILLSIIAPVHIVQGSKDINIEQLSRYSEFKILHEFIIDRISAWFIGIFVEYLVL